ncbi:hypothetical protein OEZ85_007038 [Tetradesmus obliquus]|uniref:Uncharacterized protein n=1 Tax=Tetradesmus obliquus TaxID=3088 RepID=A0ABY8U1A2_TETOB|nr:hypothetical protein OEZ85_007038 [Tetradesmus obliquus]
MSQHVVESGGLAVLQALLPEPPAPPPTAEELAAFMSSSGGIADTVDGLKLPPKLAASKHSAAHDRPDGAQGAADAAMPGGGARAPSPQKGAAGSTAAKPAAAAGTKKPGAATGSPHEQGASGAGATTPRKGAAASSSGAKEAKAVAQCGLAQQASVHAHQAIARALLLMPEEAFVPPARPPLPSPPATPPAPPLPTSQFAWDALGRPYITDGAVVLSSA